MNKLAITTLYVKNDKFYFLITLPILVIFILISSVLITMLTELNNPPINLDNDELFLTIESNSAIDTSEFEQIYSFTLGYEQVTSYPALIDIDRENFKINDNVTNVLLSQISSYQNSSLPIYIKPIYSDQIVIDKLIPNNAFLIPYFIAGGYPINNDEVIIGEYIANILLTTYDYEQYDELIGQKIEVIINSVKCELVIAGISAGGKDILTLNTSVFDESKPDVVSYYRKFESKEQKENFIKQYDIEQNEQVIEYYDSKNYNVLNFKLIIKMSAIIIGSIIYIAITYKPLKEIKYVINYYASQTNWRYIYVIPVVTYIIFVAMILNID